MRHVILAQARTSGLAVLEDTSERLTVETAHGLIGLRPGTAAEVAGMVAARDARWLFVMKSAVIEQIRHLMPAVAEAMRWSDVDQPGALPPNFQFVRARDVTHLGKSFLRVTLEGEDLSSYGTDAIHFRLVQPPTDAEPLWPSVNANGSTHWPEGPGAPHKPVYTVRSIDHATNTLVTDVFVHAGGRTTSWAAGVLHGDTGRQVVGIVGPSGGGLLTDSRVLIASDETGFPSVARFLETMLHGTTGEVLLEAEEGAGCAYPITAPPGIKLTWLSRTSGDRLGEAALRAFEGVESGTVWFAGEKADANRLRDAAKSAGWPKEKLRVSAFWRAQGASG